MTKKNALGAGQGFEGQSPKKDNRMNSNTVTLAPAPRIPQVVPGLSEIVEVQRVIDELSARRDQLSRQVVEDARFMDAPVLELNTFWVDGLREAHVGDVFHISDFAARDISGFDAHPASGCLGEWCGGPVGVSRGSGPGGMRCRRTNRGSWVLVSAAETAGRAVFVATGVAA